MKNIKFIVLIVTAIMMSGLTLSAQQMFDFDNPEGTYVITDYLGKRITLKLQKGENVGILMTGGKATATINGRTYLGKWHRFDDDQYVCFETYGGKKITYNLPSGPAKTVQIVMSADGRASYNSTVLEDNVARLNKDWMTVKRVGAKSQKKTRKNK